MVKPSVDELLLQSAEPVDTSIAVNAALDSLVIDDGAEAVRRRSMKRRSRVWLVPGVVAAAALTAGAVVFTPNFDPDVRIRSSTSPTQAWNSPAHTRCASDQSSAGRTPNCASGSSPATGRASVSASTTMRSRTRSCRPTRRLPSGASLCTMGDRAGVHHLPPAQGSCARRRVDDRRRRMGSMAVRIDRRGRGRDRELTASEVVMPVPARGEKLVSTEIFGELQIHRHGPG